MTIMDSKSLFFSLLVAVAATMLGSSRGNSQPGTHHRGSRSHRESKPSAYDSEYVASNWQSDIDWTVTGGRAASPTCVDIPANLSLCQNIGYSQMRLPNLLQHDTLAEVTQQAKAWVPLAHIHCHPNTNLFLCSLFSPVCLERKIFPCVSLCEAVKAGCEKRMEKYGYPWPEMLRCDKFPKDNDLCIKVVKNATQKEDNICEACKQPSTLHSLIDNYCQSDFVLRMKVSENLVIGKDSALVAMKRKKKKVPTATLR